MHATGARGEGHIDHAALEFDQHVEAILAIVEALIRAGYDGTTIENRADIGEIIGVDLQVEPPLAIIP